MTRDHLRTVPATAGCRLTKTRYDVPFGKHTIEIDVYRGRTKGWSLRKLNSGRARMPALHRRVVCGGSEREIALQQTYGWRGSKTMSYQLRRQFNIGRQSSRIAKAGRGRAGNRRGE